MSIYEDSEENESLQNLIDDYDSIFSVYIRTKDADANGNVECYTCGKVMHWKQSQNSHFIPRANLATRFHSDNCKPACKECNEYKSGNLDEYELHLEKDRPGTVEYLRELGRTVYKPSIGELKAMINETRFKVQLINKKFN